MCYGWDQHAAQTDATNKRHTWASNTGVRSKRPMRRSFPMLSCPTMPCEVRRYVERERFDVRETSLWASFKLGEGEQVDQPSSPYKTPADKDELTNRHDSSKPDWRDLRRGHRPESRSCRILGLCKEATSNAGVACSRDLRKTCAAEDRCPGPFG